MLIYLNIQSIKAWIIYQVRLLMQKWRIFSWHLESLPIVGKWTKKIYLLKININRTTSSSIIVFHRNLMWIDQLKMTKSPLDINLDIQAEIELIHLRIKIQHMTCSNSSLLIRYLNKLVWVKQLLNEH